MKAVRGTSTSESSIATRCQCGSVARLTSGLCVSCLLRDAAVSDELSEEAFRAAISEVRVPDRDWQLGAHRVLEEIGRGGMGVIYRARHLASGRIVALKRVLSYHGDSQETLARFRREAAAAASLDHPNILPIYDIGTTDDGLPYFSMKLATHGSLQTARHTLRLPTRNCVELIAKVARAVHEAHEQGLIHRDLKPGNILLDARGEPMVSDFGLAKWLDATGDLTSTLTVFGTPGYIAPEQAHGSAISHDRAVDVYSLGAVLFELLCGRPPFLGEHALAVIKQASDKPAPRLTTFVKSVDRDLETICAKCLERDPQLRYTAAADLAEDLRRWLDGIPILARRISAPQRVVRWTKRNRKLAATTGIAAAIGVGAVAVLLSNWRLSAVIREAGLTQPCIAIAPIEDLDAVSTRSVVAAQATAAVEQMFHAGCGIAVSPKRLPADAWHRDTWKTSKDAATTRFILTGTVREREGKQRVVLRLVDAKDGSTVTTWLPNGGAPLISDKVVIHDIARVLQPSSTYNRAKELPGGTHNALARSYYERGKEFFFRVNLRDLDRAIDSLRMAVRLDAQYAQAHALLATACQLRSLLDPAGTWLNESDVAAAKAVAVAPMLADAYDARAGNSLYHGRVPQSLDDYFTAYELEPGNARVCAQLADAYQLLGRLDRAMLWYEKMSRREAQPIYADRIGDIWTTLGEDGKAAEAYHTAVVFRPDLPVSAVGLARLDMYNGEFDKARLRCEEACRAYRDNPEPVMLAAQIEFFSGNFDAAERIYAELMRKQRAGGATYYGSIRFLSAVGLIRTSRGTDDGRTLLKEALAADEMELSAAPNNPALLYSSAATYAGLGNRESSLNLLQAAVRAGWIDVRSLLVDPRFGAVRSEPQFTRIVAQLQHAIRQMAAQISTDEGKAE